MSWGTTGSATGGVIFWQIDQTGCIFDGKIMHYRPDGHRDHGRNPDRVSSSLKRHYLGLSLSTLRGKGELAYVRSDYTL